MKELFKENIFALANRGRAKARETADSAMLKLQQLSLEAEALKNEAAPVVAELKQDAVRKGKAIKDDVNREFVSMSKRARKKAARLEKKAKKLEKKLRKIEKQQRKQLKKMTKKAKRCRR